MAKPTYILAMWLFYRIYFLRFNFGGEHGPGQREAPVPLRRGHLRAGHPGRRDGGPEAGAQRGPPLEPPTVAKGASGALIN